MEILSALFGLLLMCLFAIYHLTRFCRRRYMEEGYIFVGKVILLLAIIAGALYQPAKDYLLAEKVEQLHVALRCNKVKEAIALLDSGIPVNKKGKRGDRAIHAAIYSGNKELVKEVIKRGAHLEKWGMHERTPLIKASAKGDLEMVKILIDAGANLNGRSDFGATALLQATEAGHLSLVNLLLRHGADVTLADNNQRAPIHGAVDRLQPAVLEVLLNRDDCILKQDSLGWNLLHRVAFYGIMFRKKEKDILTKLTRTIELLVEKGVSWEQLENKGRSAAHMACAYQDKEVLATFIEAGCPLEVVDKEGDTPLLSAIRKRRFSKVKALYDQGASIRAQTKDGLTAYELGKKVGLYNEVLAILRPEGEVEAKEDEGSALGHSEAGASIK